MPTLANQAQRLKAASRWRARDLPSLWLMTDAQRLPDPLPAIARLPRGSAVIVRHTNKAARARLAAAVLSLCRRRGLVCVIAGDWRLAARLRADGVHLPERAGVVGIAAPVRLWARGARRLLSVAAHSARAVHGAARLRPQAIIFARAFPSPSHPGASAFGPLRFALAARRSPAPIIALGGIDGKNAQRLANSGAAGIAAIGGLI